MPTGLLSVLLVAAAAGLASVVGGLLALWQRPTTLFSSLALGFASGALLATITLEMIPRALELGSPAVVSTGFALGFIAMYGLDLFVHRGAVAGELAEEREHVERLSRRQRPLGDDVTVLAGGTSFEEFVEGLSIGAGLAVDPGLGVLIGIAIGVDNLSEGLSIGVLARAGQASVEGRHARRVLFWTGLIAATLVGSAALGWFLLRDLPEPALAFLLAFAGAGMLYLTVTELIPSAHARHYLQSAALATAIGFLTTMILSISI